ncbi:MULTISPECIES: methylated-DNA--[protein]-cysteine S-methyltransferase [unclassified Lacticaseibacillus]|uniref:methylated-DNA--[protein]-cysteine S-methyltransferase n=1 Tax=unclassified Lacticaseibacillus TaxID=2759744 RepID=UPI001943E859|nr:MULTISPECIES: methylated-DNA--[protein]-cysteine S-methyltransferase [unclassified Lacticaseibacillus]
MQAQSTYESPFGELTLLADDDHLLGIWFKDQDYFGGQFDLGRVPRKVTPVLIKTGLWLQDYFDGDRPDPKALPLQLTGTTFRQTVSRALLTVPYGEVTTYGALAAQVGETLGRPTSPRAIGNAVGHNPISIVVPCHRVVGKHGELVGYAGGIDRKMMLLGLEGHTIDVDKACLMNPKV